MYDKALACDLIIVTSPYNPWDFYKKIFGDKETNIDRFEQLKRRIALTIKMTDTNISKAEYDSSQKAYVEVAGSVRSNPYSSTSRQQVKTAGQDIYSAMFGDAPATASAEEEEAGTIGEDPQLNNAPQGAPLQTKK